MLRLVRTPNQEKVRVRLCALSLRNRDFYLVQELRRESVKYPSSVSATALILLSWRRHGLSHVVYNNDREYD